jgi:hypothetical protein
MIRACFSVPHFGTGCSHCRKTLNQMPETLQNDKAQFHYRCPFCRTLWCRQIREYETLKELRAMGFLPSDSELEELQLRSENE